MRRQMGKVIGNVRIIQKCFLVNKTGDLLVLKRSQSDRSRGGAWDLPGGGYEEGEQVGPAMRREILEESGLVASHLVPFYLDNSIDSQADLYFGHNVFVIAWVCREWVGEVTLSSEHTEYRWVTREEFVKLNFGSDGGFFLRALAAFDIFKI